MNHDRNVATVGLRDEFLSEEDLDLANLTAGELIAYWNLWLRQAQITNDLDEKLYSHGVFVCEPDLAALGTAPAPQGLPRS
jgi:hypothetical protein